MTRNCVRPDFAFVIVVSPMGNGNGSAALPRETDSGEGRKTLENEGERVNG
jgi:hypothetical protein